MQRPLPLPSISLAMIVKDEQEGLARCLESIADHVDEIIIVDTGSTDDTKIIAGQYTHGVFDFTWVNDFSVARQYALNLCTGDWILWLDGDDEVYGAAHLRRIIAQASPDVTQIHAKYVTGRDAHGNITNEFWRERLVRAGTHRWEGAIHEVLVPVTAAKMLQTNEVWVEHHGKPGHGKEALDRNIAILSKAVAQSKYKDTRMLFYLARDLAAVGRHDQALGLFKRYLKIAAWKDERYTAQLIVAGIYRLQGKYKEAIDAALGALRDWPIWPDAHFSLAETYYYLKDWQRVVAWSDLGRGLPPPDTNLFKNPLNYTYMWIIFYTNALWHLGAREQAGEWTKRALAIVPNDPMHLENLRFFNSLKEVPV